MDLARVLSHLPERQHEGHFGLCARSRGQDLPRAHLLRLDRQASVTGYCIKFKRLSLINDDALQAAIRYGMTVDKRPGPEPTRP
jgi:hypothetical protein